MHYIYCRNTKSYNSAWHQCHKIICTDFHWTFKTYILNEKNKIVASYKRKLIDAKPIWGKEKTETEKNMVEKLTWIKSVKKFKN